MPAHFEDTGGCVAGALTIFIVPEHKGVVYEIVSLVSFLNWVFASTF